MTVFASVLYDHPALSGPVLGFSLVAAVLFTAILIWLFTRNFDPDIDPSDPPQSLDQ